MSHNEAAYPQASIKPLNLRSSSRNPPAARSKVSPEQSSNSEPHRGMLVGVSRSGTMASRPRYPESGNTLGRPSMPDLVSRATSLGPVNNNSDDDVPLAVAIPGALKAQKTIRSTARKPSSRNLSTHFPPLGGSRPSTFSRTAPVSGSRSRAPSRPDTGSVSISSVPSPDDLARRLVQLQTSTGGANTLEIPRTHTSTSTRVPRQQHHERSSRTGLIPSSPGFDLSNSRDSSGTPRSRKASVTPRPSNIMDESSFDGLPGQSRSRPSVTDTSFPSANNPIGIDRPNIRTRSRTVDPKIRSPVAPPLPSPTSILPPPPLSPGPSASGTKDRPASWINFLDLGAKPVNLLSSVTNETSEEPSHKKRRSPPRQTPWQLPSPPSDGPGIPPSGPNWKIPVKLSNAMAAYREEALVAADISDEQRIFVETKQKSCVVKIGVRMRARDVMEAVLATGMLHGRNRNDRTNGGWMLFDMVNDLGLERPIREYEMITEVFATWNKNNSTNCLIVKRSGLCDVLALNNMPTSSPINHGVVQRKSRRGKWSKRSLRLCEQCLFISKKDHGRDEEMLCSLGNFDVYTISIDYTSPRPYVFALRSTDSPTMFEDASDSVHVFSCEKGEGEHWVETIMLARSFVLRQERSVLFPGQSQIVHSQRPSHMQSMPSLVNGLGRSATTVKPRKSSNSIRPPVARKATAPVPPLIDLNKNVFAEGSLLARAALGSGPS